jgi:phenylpyruvate tautomerase PptA (4-oxalocrotonate tautomerase family)
LPIITIESSVALPAEERTSALRALVTSVDRLLAIAPPTQLRLRIVDVPRESFAVGSVVGSDDEPWVVAYVHVLAGRAEAQLTAFMNEFSESIAAAFGVDLAKVRVLVHHYAKHDWQIGQRSAAASGR